MPFGLGNWNILEHNTVAFVLKGGKEREGAWVRTKKKVL